MGKRVLITAGPFVRAMGDKNSLLQEAIDAIRNAGIEIVTMNKGDNEYTLSDFERVMPGTGAVIAGSEPWAEAQFKVSKDLKIVSRFGVGFDAVDLAKAKEHGIMVTNTRVPELTNGVAELALGLTIAVYRHIALGCSDLRNRKWQNRRGRQISGRTVGIVGFGAIGQRFAAVLQGFGVKILAHDPFPNREAAAKLGAELVAMDKLLAESDIVSLSAPNIPENRHMFNAAAFAKMRDGAVFINTARGAMVDEKALHDALKSGKLSGAGIDVWETEPTSMDNPLLTLDNLVCLPHVAGETDESARAIASCTAKQVIDALSGKTPQYLLNP